MKWKCSICARWFPKPFSKKIYPQLQTRAAQLNIEANVGDSLCTECYLKLYNPNDVGPSGIAAIVSSQQISENPSQASLVTESTASLQSVGATSENDQLSNDDEILQQLKEKFETTCDNDEKYRILTTLPKSWSAYRTATEFPVSQFMAIRAKKLQLEKGIMTTPGKKLSRVSLSEETLACVRMFFNSEEISRVCPGKRDFSTVNSDGEKVQVQRRLVLCNLQEAYEIFKTEYATLKIGFSMFASNRPKHCILAGSSGTHTVCVCIYHQNVKLMFKTLQDKRLLPAGLNTYHDLFFKILCNNPNEYCWLKTCNICPGTQLLYSELIDILSERSVRSLQFKQWRQTDRCMMDLIVMEGQDFVDSLLEKLYDLSPHHFIADQQGSYLKTLKNNLNETECIVICDFSENYSFIVQDAVQGYHWANTQCTIHPFAIYYRNNAGELLYTSFVAIAEFGKHNHIAVRLFVTHCIDFIKKTLTGINKVHFFSDGSGSQYKNKMTAFNLCQMQKEFGLKSEWNFFATCHGKGPCDALGGVLKRNAAKASLQGQMITTAQELYTWANSKRDSKVHYEYFSEKDYKALEKQLTKRYTKVRQISGTQSFHNFRPKDKTTITVKRFSLSREEVHVKL